MPCAGYFLRKSLKNSSIWSHGSLRLSCFSLPCRGIPLGTSVQEIGLFYTMKQTFLPKHVGYEYNQKNPFCVQAPTKRSFSRRRGSIRAAVFSSIKQRVCFILHAFQEGVLRQIKALTTSLVFSTLADLTRDKAELVAENALLRHQLIILRRQMKRPVYRKTDRLLLVLLARMVRIWKQALFLVQPETLLRWHRELFRMFWKRKSKAHSRKPRLSPETIRLIKEMATNNRRLRSGTYPWRTPQAGYSREETNYSKIDEACSRHFEHVVRTGKLSCAIMRHRYGRVISYR